MKQPLDREDDPTTADTDRETLTFRQSPLTRARGTT